MPDYPWITSYPDGIRWDASIAATPLQHILDEAVARWPERPAITFMDRQLTYRQLGDLVARAARGLERIGVRPGMHVGLYLPNTPHMVIAFFAVLGKLSKKELADDEFRKRQAVPST